MLYPVSVKGVLFTPENKVVLLKNERNEWELPGGRLEPYETPEACLKREMQEELNIQIQVAKLLDVWLYEVLAGKHVLIVTYGCSAVSFSELRLSHEHQALGVFGLNDLDIQPFPEGYKKAIGLWAEFH